MKITVYIADDHPMIIEGLRKSLPHYPHIDVKDAFKNGNDLLQGLEAFVPDVLLLDIQMPDLTGDELAPILRKKYPDLKILVLTNFDSALYARNMFLRGAHGYLLKTAENTTLVAAIEAVHRGEEFVEEVMQEKIDKMALREKNAVFSKATLTPREKEVLQHLVNGQTAPQIAETCFLSLRTVVNYRTSIMRKLDAHNTATLVKKALLLGLAE